MDSLDKQSAIQAQLSQLLPGLLFDEPLAKYSTMRVGGPARYFLTTKTTAELIQAMKVVWQFDIPYHLLGGGSNTLFADSGFAGLVIRHQANQIIFSHGQSAESKDQIEELSWSDPYQKAGRYVEYQSQQYLQFADLDYAERPGETVVRVESGTNLTGLIVKTLDRNLSGLQWFGGIPGTLGGAVWNNIHGGTHLLAERVHQVTALNQAGQLVYYSPEQVGFGYDISRFHQSGEIILSTDLLLTQSTELEIERAEKTFREWVRRKAAMQPKQGSLGSTFKNISEAERLKHNLPTGAAGYLIDQVGLKGRVCGGATIYDQHANFIINQGQAKASDIIELMLLAQRSVQAKFGIRLEPEIVLVGQFDEAARPLQWLKQTDGK